MPSLLDRLPPPLQITPPDPNTVTQADALCKTCQSIQDWQQRQQQQSQDEGLWTGGGLLDGGHPTDAGFKGVAQQVAGGIGPGDIGGGLLGGIKGYHGSPHSFDRFDTSAIGTGEGAQAYGHGLYFAENEGIAKGYRDRLTDTDNLNYVDPDGARVPYGDLYGKGYSAVADIPGAVPDVKRAVPRHIIDAMETGTPPEKYMSEYEVDPKYAPHYQAAADALAGYQHSVNPGSMYEVNINADPDHFLHWDKPRDQLAPAVQDFAKTNYPNAWENAADGSSLYHLMAKDGGAAEVSRKMADAGIPGIKYLDAGSRNDRGDPTHNYVVFDAKNLEIMRKYGIAGLLAGAGAAATAGTGQQEQ